MVTSLRDELLAHADKLRALSTERSPLYIRSKREQRDIDTAQRAVNRVALYKSVYPTPHQATRIAAFVILARMEAEREALA